jgi:hypothetical protein
MRLQRACHDTLPWLISVSLDLLRSAHVEAKNRSGSSRVEAASIDALLFLVQPVDDLIALGDRYLFFGTLSLGGTWTKFSAKY